MVEPCRDFNTCHIKLALFLSFVELLQSCIVMIIKALGLCGIGQGDNKLAKAC